MKPSLVLAAVFAVLVAPAQAAIFLFDLAGKSGLPGLQPGNENQLPAVVSGASGGEVDPGIFFDDGAGTLTINIAWTGLTGPAIAAHLHGPASFLENAGVLIGFNNFPAAAAGTFNATLGLSQTQKTSLFDGKLYINIHTAQFPGGELRGQLVLIPEPSTYALLALGLGGLVLALRRRRTLAA